MSSREHRRSASSPDDPTRERQFYRQLLELVRHDEPSSLVENALALLIELTGARVGFLELFDDGDEDPRSWTAVHGCNDDGVAQIRSLLSTGIISETLTSGETVLTAAAHQDTRFQHLESVKRGVIESVVCAPVGGELPLGFVYIQGVRESTGRPFGALEVEHVTLFARSVAPLVSKVLEGVRERTSVGLGVGFDDLVSRSATMASLATKLRLAAPLDVLVLFSGATGTGKTLLAQRIHALSGRRGAFVEVNCAALPDTLFESELFGAVAGGHSTAHRASPGKIAAAEGGTLFLDEIGETSLLGQSKLLQFLQSKQYYPLGASEARRADVRVVVATNRDLGAAVSRGEFRDDLYFRLCVLEMRVPTLAERPEDILPLATHFAQVHARRHGFQPRSLSSLARRALVIEEWPGNVRELSHRVEAAVINAQLRGATYLDVMDLCPAGAPSADGASLEDAVRAFKLKHVRSVLTDTDWNVAESARLLGVARSHLYTLIRAYDLKR